MATPEKDELKKKLYELIDGIDDQRILTALNEFIIPFVTQVWAEKPGDDLRGEQFQQYDSIIVGTVRGEVTGNEEFTTNMDEWLAWLEASGSNN